MTYNVFGRTLNLAQSINYSPTNFDQSYASGCSVIGLFEL